MYKKLKFLTRSQHAISLAIFLIILAISILTSLIFSDTFTSWNNLSHDYLFRLRFRLTGPETLDKSIIHVNITDENLASGDSDRQLYTRLIKILRKASVYAVITDILFYEENNPEIDRELAAFTEGLKNVYFPLILRLSDRDSQKMNFAITANKEIDTDRTAITPVVVKNDKTHTGKIRMRPFNSLIKASAGLGHINCIPDKDGVMRSFPLLVQDEDNNGLFYPAMPVAFLMNHYNTSELVYHAGKHLILKNATRPGKTQKDIKIPIDNTGAIHINWPGPWNETFPHLSAVKILEAENNPLVLEKLFHAVQGKIVVLADISSKASDYGPGVFNRTYSYSFIHSTIVNSVLTGNYMYRSNGMFLMVIILILMCAGNIYPGRKNALAFYIVTDILFLLILVVTGIFFLFFNIFIPPTPALCGLVTAFIILGAQRLLSTERKERLLTEQKKLDRMKRAFVTNISHEFNLPLSVLSGYIEKLEKGTGCQQETVEMIRHSASRLLYLNTNLENLSTLDGSIATSFKVFDLIAFLQRLVSNFMVYLHNEITLVFEPGESAILIKTDPKKLEIIVTRLLLHSLTTSEPKKTIRLNASYLDSPKGRTEVGITVYDEGPMLENSEAATFLTRITESMSMRAFGEAGLSLTIAYELVRLLGGSFVMKNNPSKGMSLSVLLPVQTDIKGKTDDIEVGASLADIMNTYSAQNRSHDAGKSGSTGKPVILVIEADWGLFRFIRDMLLSSFEVAWAADGVTAGKLIRKVKPKLIICNERLPGKPGFEVMQELSQTHGTADIPVLFMMSGLMASANQPVNSFSDVISIPFTALELQKRVHDLVPVGILSENKHGGDESKKSASIKHPEVFEPILTVNRCMFTLFENLEKIAESPRPVLITGETGVGKELVADAVYKLGCHYDNHAGAFMKVNIAGRNRELVSDDLFGHKKGAFSGASSDKPGFVESVNGGTLFLDEVGDLDPDVQVKLLRLIEYGEYIPLGSDEVKRVDVKIIAATNANLSQKVKNGTFRQDLFFRLAGHRIEIPALRDRITDLEVLVPFFVERASKILKKKKPYVVPGINEVLSGYSFPGNVRELEALMFDSVSSCSGAKLTVRFFKAYVKKHSEEPVKDARITIEAGDVKEITVSGGVMGLEELTDRYILQVVAMSKNQKKASEMLGIAPYTLSRRLKEIKKRISG